MNWRGGSDACCIGFTRLRRNRQNSHEGACAFPVAPEPPWGVLGEFGGIPGALLGSLRKFSRQTPKLHLRWGGFMRIEMGMEGQVQNSLNRGRS